MTTAEAGRRAWKGTTKAQRAQIMRERAWARWHFPCGQPRSAPHDAAGCITDGCPGRQEA